ncbi:Acg family FMN-binding oxidoreductase [Paraburkholderia silvatlantica]|uniref:Nitroreductase n=1 Tax=Paraburkholderia silvatlantica TaxID=321895 RepID=A0ABR6FHI3_9BURK|nr:nitroreductase family protein [Paraburkholderia silvatlantica]MBB2926548.1 nitroreductase [Paraburkholderia silvatlantica]PVY37811.1 nitroreductase family protein [Paraburkholderia silvatlantica]PXW42775.1 nitroreductase family protein [Paraburkholderia silvatlantica]
MPDKPNDAAASATPLDKLDDYALRYAVRHATLAPSSHNSQPWRFVPAHDRILLCADRLRALPVVDPFDRELIISCGAALFNLRVALASLGIGYAITLFPTSLDPDVLADVRLLRERPVGADLVPLLNAISLRVTTRRPFSPAPVSAAVEHELIEAARTEGVDVACATEAAKREAIADLIAQADRRQFADPRFRRELAKWIHPRRTGDGMPAYAAGLAPLLDFAAPLVASAIRTFDMGGGVAATHRELAAGSPLLLCIATSVDDAQAWLAAGEALERVLLVLTVHGLCASYLNQPIEVAELRSQLGTLLGMPESACPQLLLRIGHGTPDAPSPRRPLSEVVA